MPHDRHQDLTGVHRWVESVAPELGLNPADIPVGDILDLATAVAHGVARPGVPVTGFLAGLAAGRGVPIERVLPLLTERARTWHQPGATTQTKGLD